MAAQHGGLDDAAGKGRIPDEDGNEMRYVVLKLDEGDARWWDSLRLRKNDEGLMEMEKDGRPWWGRLIAA